MSLLPPGLKERIVWYEAHIAQFAANAVAIGSSVAETTALQTKIASARSNLTDQQTAQQTAKTATETLRTSVDAMVVAGSNLIAKVRAKAMTDGDGIYALAGIPAPATPTPIGAPGTPTELKVVLNPDGSIEMTWKCANPAGATGVIYHVYRSTTGADDSYAFVGGAGARTFTDTTVPSSLPIVYYRIQAVRTTAIGQSADFMVRFGKGSSGITVTAMAPKLAA